MQENGNALPLAALVESAEGQLSLLHWGQPAAVPAPAVVPAVVTEPLPIRDAA